MIVTKTYQNIFRFKTYFTDIDIRPAILMPCDKRAGCGHNAD
jgi:hypothetical protein